GWQAWQQGSLFDQGRDQPQPQQYPQKAGQQPAAHEGAHSPVDQIQPQNDGGNAQDAAIDTQGPGKTIDKGCTGTRQNTEQPAEGVDDQTYQRAKEFTQPFGGTREGIHCALSPCVEEPIASSLAVKPSRNSVPEKTHR